MNLFNIMGLVSTLALALPIIILLTSKLAWYRSFPALFFYYFVVLNYTIALMGYIDTGSDYKYYHGVICNFLDTPLILLFLTYFSKTVHFRKKLQIVTLLFIAFEIVTMIMYGFNRKSNYYHFSSGTGAYVNYFPSLLYSPGKDRSGASQGGG